MNMCSCIFGCGQLNVYMYLHKLVSLALKSILVSGQRERKTCNHNYITLCCWQMSLKTEAMLSNNNKKGGATCIIWVAVEWNDLPCSNEPPWILEMQAVLTCTLKLIHLDQCLQALAARDADRISRFHLQRKEVISMLSLPFKTWFPYSLPAQVTHLRCGQTLEAAKATSKLSLKNFWGEGLGENH